MLCYDDKVLKLRRCLYGLKQSLKLWFDKWSTAMGDIVFHRLGSDNCMSRGKDIWLMMYVDDIILMDCNGNALEGSNSDIGKFVDVKKNV